MEQSRHLFESQDPAQEYVSSEELVRALTSIETQQMGETADRLKIGEAIRQLGLDLTPEQILAAVNEERERQSVMRNRATARSKTIKIVAIIAIVTIVGAPLGLGVLLGFLPLLAFAGFLVAGIYVGEEILGTRKEPLAQHPYRGALLGIVLLQIIGIVPVVGGLVTAVASLIGFGAILLLAWRIVRGTGETTAPQAAPVAIGA